MTSIAVVLNGPKTRNGRRVFESFQYANQQCFWNRELVGAADALKYMGFMRPGTLFVSAPAVHLQALKSAWARRILKPADGYQIASVGELGQIQPVEQMHFVPLGDVICDTIAQLNRMGLAANLAAIRAHVTENCQQVAPPSLEMVRQTVSSLTATGLVYRMGDHHFVSVPTTSPVKLSEEEKQTVECQTGMSIILPEKKTRKGILARFFQKRSPLVSAVSSQQPIAFSTEFPPPQWLAQANSRVPEQQQQQPPPSAAAPVKQSIVHNKFPTFNERLCEQAARVELCDEQQKRRSRRKDHRRQMSSSSECLNYGPIDPPELLPDHIEVLEAICNVRPARRRPRTGSRKAPLRSSTPVDSDSAYSPSPVTDSNEEEKSGSNSWSEPEEARNNHTYINLHCDSTHFEDISLLPPPPILPHKNVHISSV